MSVQIISHLQINAILNFGIANRCFPNDLPDSEIQKAGFAMQASNETEFWLRYAEKCDNFEFAFVRDWRVLSPLKILKLIQSLKSNMQVPQKLWDGMTNYYLNPYKLLENIQDRAIEKLEGYTEAPWTIE